MIQPVAFSGYLAGGNMDYPFSPYLQPDDFILWARHQGGLSEEIQCAVLEFRDRGNAYGILHLTGLPIDVELPLTPVNGAHPDKRTFVSELVMALIGTLIGEQVGYKQEKNAALFHQITPSESEALQQSSEGSQVRLKLHTERCFHPYRPDFLLLFCLRQEPSGRAATVFAGIREIFPLLKSRTRDMLFKPLFRTGIDYSFIKGTNRVTQGPVLSVLYGDREDPCLLYDEDLMSGLTPEAEDALRELAEALRDNTHTILLQPGEMLLIDNRFAVHGRAGFHAGYGRRERWLQRAYIVSDLRPSEQDRLHGGRVIATVF
jgi:alpha-ketoglutarate-dependent taurine dioxygenase